MNHQKSVTYPTNSLFFSQPWLNRTQNIGLSGRELHLEKYKGIRIATRVEGEIADYESIPSKTKVTELCRTSRSQGADWFVIRKLTEKTPTNSSQTRSRFFNYSRAPYLDLTAPTQVKKEVLSHLGRTERKIARELGTIRLCRANDKTKFSWFKQWSDFEKKNSRFSETKFELYSQWLLGGKLEPWMRLMSLIAEDKSGATVTLALGIFYCWNGVFYYYAPVMNPDPRLQKYGGGKLLVQKLIELARTEGCHTFDFLQGEHSYKFHWNPQTRPLYQYIVPLTFKGTIALGYLRLKHLLSSNQIRKGIS